MADNSFSIYCKPTSNYHPGAGLETFERLGPEWTGDSIWIPFGLEGEARRLQVVGWSDLNYGTACPVKVVGVRWTPAHGLELDGDPPRPLIGFLLYGGNSGVRVLDPEAAPQAGVTDYLPNGWGWPWIWITDPGDLPPEVLEVVGHVDIDPQPPRRRGAVFTVGELAEVVTGGNEGSMRRLLNTALRNYEMPRPLFDEYQTHPAELVSRDLVIACAALFAGSRVGYHCAALLGETRTREGRP